MASTGDGEGRTVPSVPGLSPSLRHLHSGHNQEDVGKYFTTPFGAGGAGQPWFVAFDSCGVNTPTAVCLELSI